MKTNAIVPWTGPAGVTIPNSVTDPEKLISYAVGLRPPDQKKIVHAFESQSFDMAAEFAWRRSMSKLRSTLAGVGMRFLGEMLGRDDLDEYSSAETVLNDYDCIRLAESLGVVNTTGALRLRHAFEVLSHFDREETDEDLSPVEALQILRTCIQYVLGHSNITAAMDFSRLRDRLLSESLKQSEPDVTKLLASPIFFLRTTLRVLLAAVKKQKGARLEHSLANFNLLLSPMWSNLPEQDRWAVGQAYAELSNEGNSVAVSGVKKALLKVAGFDYVPENLRSNSYRKAAQAVVSAHFDFGNFYSEAEPINQLANMGTTIPQAVLAECMQAYLCVFLGNHYGNSWTAAPTAEKQLRQITSDRWTYYLTKLLPGDEVILEKLTDEKPVLRFIYLAQCLGWEMNSTDRTLPGRLVSAAVSNRARPVQTIAAELLSRMKGVTVSVEK